MRRTLSLIGGLVVAGLVTPLPVWAQDASSDPVVVSHTVLASSVQRMAAQSSSWREAINAVAATGRRALVITPDQVKTPMEAETLAQVFPIADEQSRVDTVLVVVNLELLKKLSGLPVTAVDFEDDVDRVIAHEVYGHAIPFLLSGSLAGNCPDPVAGQSAAASCVIQRENVIRREMRLGLRSEYGRDSLAIARRGWQQRD
jgi:hypothetical protein